MTELTFNVEHCPDTGWLVASWDEAGGVGGITTQGKDLRELEEIVKDAVRCHFDEGHTPQTVRLHFLNDRVLETV